MLYRTIKRLIERGITDGLEEKIYRLWVAGKLTNSEYDELISMINVKN